LNCSSVKTMEKKLFNNKWLAIGAVVSLIIGMALGYLTEEPYLGIAAGIFMAFIIQRFGATKDSD